MSVRRRSLLGAMGLGLAGATAPGIVARAAGIGSGAGIATGAAVTLLGTAGGPPPHADRSQPATLLTLGGRSYLIDAGENVGQQLVRAGSSPAHIDATLLTHLHWDHTLGLGYLLASGWMMGRTAAMPVWGPPGTRQLVDAVLAEVGIGEAIFRAQMPGRPSLAGLYPVHEIDAEAIAPVFDDGTVRVSTCPTTHYAGDPPAPHPWGANRALAYRFDSAEGSVVLTGDTGPSDMIARLATGADMLVAEIADPESIRGGLVAAGSAGAELDRLMDHMRHQHLTADALGAMAAAAGVKRLVLTHFVIGRGFDPQALLAPLRRHYDGEIVLGRDLMRVPLRG